MRASVVEPTDRRPVLWRRIGRIVPRSAMPLAHDIAATILDGFDKHYRIFRAISAQAKDRFERADWAAVREASRARIDLYDQRVREAVAAVREKFPALDAPAVHGDDAFWLQLKQAYISLLYEHRQPECAETFYNSVACRVLDRTYYRNDYIFWRPAVSTEFIDGAEPTYRCWYPATQGLRSTLTAIVESFGLRVPFEDLRRDLRLVLRTLRASFPGKGQRHPNYQVQVLSSLFYRNKGAYIVGRILNGNLEQPFAVPIRHQDEGKTLALDALLLESQHLAALFSLARSYFLVDMDAPSAWVGFLKKLMPAKSLAELYTAVGLQKQGKTLFYRELFDHLKHSSDSFTIAPGARGMVMAVFTLPSFPYVFKVIRDEFEPPKQTTRAEVMSKYLLVKVHDRVGRMADTLEYSQVAFPLARLEPALLSELTRSCPKSLERDGDRLVIKHLYLERRMTPLDVYLRSADPAQARHAIDEFGKAIRELAEANIFPGDLLPKNFGVTRWGRVVFYDYDELCTVTELKFRHIPKPRCDDEELAAEPWYSVGPQDVFPEELTRFLFSPGPQRDLFLALHGDVVDADWWTARQADLRAGGQADLFPYPARCRFSTRTGRAGGRER